MIIVYGGSFDPIHNGHTQLADTIIHWLHPAQFRFLPCYSPVHKSTVKTDAAHRVKMINIAIQDMSEQSKICSHLDEREIVSKKASYTYDTLVDIRTEIGENESLVFVIGADSLHTLNSWYRWQELLDIAHLLVVSRQEYSLEILPDDISRFLSGHKTTSADEFSTESCGHILIFDRFNADISSTSIRNHVKDHKNWMSSAVYSYISENHLYNSQP